MMKDRCGKYKAISRIAVWMLLFCAVFAFRTEAFAKGTESEPEVNMEIEGKKTSYLTVTGSGYMRVYVKDKQLKIEYLDTAFQVTSRKSIDLELPEWGGFYAGRDAYYVVLGVPYSNEDTYEEAIRVIKYDKSWNRIGAASLDVDQTNYNDPIQNADVAMEEKDGYLYLTLAPLYNGAGRMYIRVDEELLSAEMLCRDYEDCYTPYMALAGDDIYLVGRNNEARCARITRLNPEDPENPEDADILSYGGQSGKRCFASVDGLAASDTHLLSVGTSIDQSLYDSVSETTSHNVYLSVTPIDGFSTGSTAVKWLTDFADERISFNCVKITKVSKNRFLIMWQEHVDDGDDRETRENTLHYLVVDGEGNTIGGEYTATALLSDCVPCVQDSKVFYYASIPNRVIYYTIDTKTGKLTAVEHRSLGGNIIWDLKDGVLTISGTGALDFQDSYSRYARSYTGYWSVDGHDIWEGIRDQVTKIVISDGITCVQNSAFYDFDKLQEVVLGNSISSVGDRAFAYNYDLSRVYFRSKNVDIGEDAFFSGYYSYTDQKLYFVTLLCPEGSNVKAYADQNGIRSVYYHTDANGNLITGVVKQNGEWCYLNEYGILEEVWGWIDSNGKKYYFDDGKPYLGWHSIDGCDYYFGDDAAVKYGWLTLDGKRYYLDDKGKKTGWELINGKYYYFSEQGVMQTGWIRIVGRYFFLDSQGVMQTGWLNRNGKYYYLNADGVMQTGRVKIDGAWYTFARTGELTEGTAPVTPSGSDTSAKKSGWKKENGKWYLYKNGKKLTGWQKSGKKWYFLNKDGSMKTGWLRSGKKWYFLNKDGAMKTGWLKSGKKWYFLNKDGSMKTGWQRSSGKWYYLDTAGVMVTGKRTIKGVTYIFDGNGCCTNP